MKNVAFSILVFAALLIGAAGCGEAEELYNCASVCEAYGDCAEALGVDIDETDCVDGCEQASDEDPNFAQAIERCENCLEAEAACVESYECVDECASVVPEITVPEIAP